MLLLNTVSKQSTTLNTVLKLIPQLNPKELIAVRDRVHFLVADTSAGKLTDDWLTDGICNELVRRGLLRKGMDWRRVAPKNYRRDVAGALEFLFAALRRPLTTPEKYALGRVVALALADYLANTPGFGLRVMLQGVRKVPEALDRSFPGYVASGMLYMLIMVK